MTDLPVGVPTDHDTAETQSQHARWEADILLADGQPARLRPLVRGDEAALDAFWGTLSPRSQYFRFFTPHPRLNARDKARFLDGDLQTQVSLGVFIGAELVAIGDFTRTAPTEAELAFVVRDELHGYGVGGLLLEHLAQIARELGITRLTAEVLPENDKMMASFRVAGYEMHTKLTGDAVHFEFSVEPTDTSMAVMAAREHRAEASSMRRVFEARSVAIVGGSARHTTVGRLLMRNALDAEFTGRLYLVNPTIDAAFGIPAYKSVLDLPEAVDLAVIAVKADLVPDVIADCAAKKVHAVLVVSVGYAEVGREGRRRQARLLEQCRSAGIRLVGPCALGLIRPVDNSLNASLCDVLPESGPIGFFCQSGPLSLTALRMLVDRGLGVSGFVSAGNRADVSGNDLLQYWDEDDRTEVILAYLESLGNAEKFSRLARRVSRRKPVVVLTSGSSGFSLGLRAEDVAEELTEGGGDPFAAIGAVAASSAAASAAVVDAMFRQAGVIRVDHIEHLFDVAQVLARQPLPQGRRLAIVGDSPELTIIAADVASQSGFYTRAGWIGLADLSPATYEERLSAAMADDRVDAVLAVFVPAPAETKVRLDDIRAVIARHGNHPTKPLVAVITGDEEDVTFDIRAQGGSGASGRGAHAHDEPDAPPPLRGSVPTYPGPERAILALSKAREYARWRQEMDARLPILTDVDVTGAADLLAGVLSASPQGRPLSDEEVNLLLRMYGVPILPYRRTQDLDEAVTAAEELGWEVALKVPKSVGVVSDQRVWARIGDPNELAVAWRQLTEAFGPAPAAGVVVQRMGSPGRHLSVRAWEDEQLGAVLAFRVASASARLLHDASYRLMPLSRRDAATMIREVQLAPMLTGTVGFPARDVKAVEDLIIRIAQLKEDQPDIDRLDVEFLAHDVGVSVEAVRVWARKHTPRPEIYARRLSSSPDGI